MTVVERGLVVRERVFVPLWVTALERVAAWWWHLLVRLARLVIHYPIPVAALVVEVAAYRWRGWPAVITLTVVVLLILLGWAWRWPGSFGEWVRVPVRSWWRFQRLYGRRWRPLMAGCGLIEVLDGVEVMPQILRLRSERDRDELLLTLAAGQIPDDVSVSADALAHGLGAWRASTLPAGSGRVVLVVLWTDPLASPIHPDDDETPETSGKGDVRTARGVGRGCW